MPTPIDNSDMEQPGGGNIRIDRSGQESMNSNSSPVDPQVWRMLADISQSLQVSSASIKAAITSLLDTTIIWDRSAQHEFMVSINQSIDRSFPLIVALTLAMKSEGGSLEWVIEPCSLQEIVARVTDNLVRDNAGAAISLALPADGKPILVDYDYLRIALKLLLEALVSIQGAVPNAMRISTIEDETHWRVIIEGDFERQATELIVWLSSVSAHLPPFPREIHSEIMLKAFTAIRMLNHQGIDLIAPSEAASLTSFVLVIPSVGI